MKQQLTRAIARNLVIVAAMGLTVVASWAVTGTRQPTIEMGTVNACSVGSMLAGADRVCKTGAQQG